MLETVLNSTEVGTLGGNLVDSVLNACHSRLSAVVGGDIKTANSCAGRTGNEVFLSAVEQGKEAGLRPMLYTHPLGLFGHACGPTIGLWDHQEGVEGSGDYPLHDNTAYSLELNATVYSKTYGCDIRMAMESDILLQDGKVYFLAGRQENFHVVK